MTMFTGIIEDVGRIEAFENAGTGARARIAARFAKELVLGESVAVDGCCLTVTRADGASFDADLSAETLARTSFGAAGVGTRVNLERSLAANARLGGHIVQGHVDGVGSVASVAADGDTRVITFRAPAALLPFLAEKGSIAVDGVSLTVNAVTADGFRVTLVPFTLSHTAFDELAAGDPVNLEADVVAKYVLRGLENLTGKKLPGGITEQLR